jgi:PleD family two-component response regulator
MYQLAWLGFKLINYHLNITSLTQIGEVKQKQTFMKVLLVEDEPDLGTAIKRTLNQEKYIVDWVMDGNEAWYCLESQWTEYTLAIFDWLLPGNTRNYFAKTKA